MPYTETYCQPTASNLNAGSTQADAAIFTYASGNWVAGTGVFTVASGNPLTDGVVVGDWASVYPNGSTLTVFVGRVTNVSATTITVSLTLKSGTAPVDGTGTRTLKIGGAWKGPNAAENFPFGFLQNTHTNASTEIVRANFKGTFPVTAAISHSLAGPALFEGYTTTPGDGGTAKIDGGTSGASYVLFSVTGNNNGLAHLEFANNGATGVAGGVTISASRTLLRRCFFHDFRGAGLTYGANGNEAIECEAYNVNLSVSASIAGFMLGAGGGALFKRCFSHDNTGTTTAGFRVSSTGIASFLNCIAHKNAGDGYTVVNTALARLTECEAYDNGGDGIDLGNTAGNTIIIENCNLLKNLGWGINGSSAFQRLGYVANCGFGAGTMANTLGTITGLNGLQEIASVNYPADVTPWVNPDAGDFRIALAEAKGTGRATFFQMAPGYAGTIGYIDRGAAQHLEPVGGTKPNYGIRTGGRL